MDGLSNQNKRSKTRYRICESEHITVVHQRTDQLYRYFLSRGPSATIRSISRLSKLLQPLSLTPVTSTIAEILTLVLYSFKPTSVLPVYLFHSVGSQIRSSPHLLPNTSAYGRIFQTSTLPLFQGHSPASVSAAVGFCDVD